MSYLGAVEDIGLSPYRISGDPVTALVAQLNRFADKTVKAGKCESRKLLLAPYQLSPALSQRAAETAALIVWWRYACAPLDAHSVSKEKWASEGHTGGNPWVFVMNNLNEITVTIAQFGDSLGLAPASVGITRVDPKMAPKFPMMTVMILGGLAVAAVAVSRRKQKR